MIEQLNDRQFLLAQLPVFREQVERLLAPRRGRGRRDQAGADGEPPLDAADVGQAVERLDALQSALETSPSGAPTRRRGATDEQREPYLPEDPLISLMQSVLDAYFDERQPDAVQARVAGGSARRRGRPVVAEDQVLADMAPTSTSSSRRLFKKFQYTDPGWLGSAFAHAIRRLRDKHPFNRAPARTVTLPQRTRLVMVGDWGSGIPRAQTVARHMRTHIEQGVADQREVHVIHLGDVYYSGWSREYKKRFLPYWPVRVDEADTITSWCLNANHDMYSGGHGYFETLLADPRFRRHEGSSWFTLQHPDWTIVGLDTAWDEQGLHDPRTTTGLADPQAEHLHELTKQGAPPLVLLSHHQLFSAWEDPGPYLRLRLSDDVLDPGHVKAWFWAHEHRAVAYEPFGPLPFGRCIGHGGVPVWASGQPRAANGRPAVTWRETGVVTHGVERFAKFGFAVADLDGPGLRVRYFDEDDACSFDEVIS